jgi:hypothetical protein
MALDLRYMKSGRGAGTNWFFVYNIPPELRGHPQFMTRRGKPMTVTESLGTADPHEARIRRDERIVYWNRQFRMLRDGPSEDDIREEAVEVYRAALKLKAEVKQAVPHLRNLLEENAEKYPQELDFAIAHFARDEVDDYCKRAGITLEYSSEPYRKLGVAFIEAKIAAGLPGVWLPRPDGRISYGEEAHLPPLPKVEPPVAASPLPSPLPALSLPRRETETFSEAFEAYLRTELD